jgi:PAS domain S-box-containing protein
VAIGTPSGKLEYINDSGQKFTGFSTETVLSHTELSKIFAANSVTKILDEAIPEANRTGSWSGINDMIDRSGNKVPVSQVVLSHRNADGKTEYYSTIIRDISEQKKIERDLIFKNNELDTFVYSAGHDLKGPIASLKGLHSIIEFEVDDKKALEYFDKYHKQILRLDQIVQTLLELTRIKEREINSEPVDIQGIVSGTIDAYSHFTNFDRIEFDISINLKKPIHSDENLIRTIIQNLIENSIKYCREDAHPKIRVYVGFIDEKQITIQVEDNGVGIKPEYREKIFNMFFRGHEKSQGSGLGLYILKNAVDKLGGTVLFESEVDEGTTFTVNFPVR